MVINHEEQYSIWFEERKLPLGWNTVGKTGSKQECLDYIEEVWTDVRPLSLRKKMDEAERTFELMMSRFISLIDQPLSMKRLASQSSSSG